MSNPIKDSIFKELFEDRTVFYDFLKAFLPKEITKQIKETDLKREQTELIGKDFSIKRSDILYKIEKENGQDVYIYLLLEHQSKVDQLMAFRMLAYKVRIWEQYVKSHKRESEQKGFKLPVIIGIVFYDGKAKWTSPMDVKDKITEIKNMEDYLIKANYELINLSSIKEETIINMKKALGVILLTDKPNVRIKNAEELLKIINEEIISKLPEEEKEKFDKHRNAFIELFGKRTDYEEIKERYEELKEMEVPKMFDTLEKIAKRDREKAKLEGVKEGERKGKLEGERELIIEILNQRFGEDFDKRLKENIRKANEETINQIKKNILNVTLEELKELLK
ncbi:Rpn family recombination-promoting nuclease/putative transposase [Petrotoga sp. DB-2]